MNNERKLVISSYKKGLPRLGLLIQVAFVCGIPIAILVYGIIIATGGAFPFSGWLVAFFFSCSVIIGIIAVWNLIPESVEINDYGIKITKGWKNKEATWSEISKIRGKRTIEWIGRIMLHHTRPAIVVKTERWKHTIVERRYSTEELKNVFISVAEHVTPIGAIIEDELGWLPERLYPREKVYLGRMRGYTILSKVGGFMMLIGIILFAMITFGEMYFIGGIILLFIGGMCALCGCLGYFDEKKKLEKNK